MDGYCVECIYLKSEIFYWSRYIRFRHSTGTVPVGSQKCPHSDLIKPNFWPLLVPVRAFPGFEKTTSACLLAAGCQQQQAER